MITLTFDALAAWIGIAFCLGGVAGFIAAVYMEPKPKPRRLIVGTCIRHDPILGEAGRRGA